MRIKFKQFLLGISILLGLTVPAFVFANNIFQNGFNVGIGTTVPATTLSISTSTKYQGLTVTNSGGGKIDLTDNGTTHLQLCLGINQFDCNNAVQGDPDGSLLVYGSSVLQASDLILGTAQSAGGILFVSGDATNTVTTKMFMDNSGKFELGGQTNPSTLLSLGPDTPSVLQSLGISDRYKIGVYDDGLTGPLTIGASSTAMSINAPRIEFYGSPAISTQLMSIVSGVGIGVGSSSPSGNFAIQGGTGSGVFGRTFAIADTSGVERYLFRADGNLGIGTSTPWGLLSVNPNALAASVPAFVVGSSTGTDFIVNQTGNVGIGSSTPSTTLGLVGNEYLTGGLGVGVLNTTAKTVLLQTSASNKILLSAGALTAVTVTKDPSTANTQGISSTASNVGDGFIGKGIVSVVSTASGANADLGGGKTGENLLLNCTANGDISVDADQSFCYGINISQLVANGIGSEVDGLQIVNGQAFVASSTDIGLNITSEAVGATSTAYGMKGFAYTPNVLPNGGRTVIGLLYGASPSDPRDTAIGIEISSPQQITVNDPQNPIYGLELNNVSPGTDANNNKWQLYNNITNTTQGKLFLGSDGVKTYWGSGKNASLDYESSATGYMAMLVNGATPFNYPGFTSGMTVDDVATTTNIDRAAFASWASSNVDQSAGILVGYWGGMQDSGTGGVNSGLNAAVVGYNNELATNNRTVASNYGGYFSTDANGTGLTITNNYGIYTNALASGSSNITNNYGIYIDNSVSSNITTNYALYLAEQTKGTTKYGIYQPHAFLGDNNNVLYGKLGLATTTPNKQLTVGGDVAIGNGAAGNLNLIFQGAKTGTLQWNDSNQLLNLQVAGAPYFDYPGETTAYTIDATTTGTRQIRGGMASWISSSQDQASTGYLYGFIGGYTDAGNGAPAVGTAIGAQGYNYLTATNLRTLSTVKAGDFENDFTGAQNLSITDLYGFYTNAGNNAGSGTTVGTLYGVYIDNPAAINSVTTSYGLYINGQTRGTTKYQLYSAGTANSYFAGAIGIASTSPWRTFDVNGTVSMKGLTTAAGALAGGSYLCLNSNNEVVADTATCLVSSARFKHDITALTPGIDEVMQLKPVSFVYNPAANLPTGQQLGLIAEDVMKVEPRLVELDNSGKPFTVRYENLTALLVKAIQDQQGEIQNIKVGVRSVEENWQWLAIGLLGLGFVYQQIQIKKLRK